MATGENNSISFGDPEEDTLIAICPLTPTTDVLNNVHLVSSVSGEDNFISRGNQGVGPLTPAHLPIADVVGNDGQGLCPVHGSPSRDNSSPESVRSRGVGDLSDDRLPVESVSSFQLFARLVNNVNITIRRGRRT